MKSVTKCPKFTTISAASDGDVNAIKKILFHYDAYISKSCLRPLYDEHGGMYITLDTELKGIMRTALIAMILNFEVEVV